jgi:hypothetical protein
MPVLNFYQETTLYILTTGQQNLTIIVGGLLHGTRISSPAGKTVPGNFFAKVTFLTKKPNQSLKSGVNIFLK